MIWVSVEGMVTTTTSTGQDRTGHDRSRLLLLLHYYCYQRLLMLPHATSMMRDAVHVMRRYDGRRGEGRGRERIGNDVVVTT